MKNMPDTFSIYFACLQISPFLTVILYSFWAIPPNKIGKHAQVKHFHNRSMKHPGISDRSSLLCRHSIKFQFIWQKLYHNIPLVGLLQKYVGLRDSSAKYQKSFMCLCKMCLMVVLQKRTFHRNDDLSTTCQCWQLKLNPLSMQINIYCLMNNQTPVLLVQPTSWMQDAVMLLPSIYFSRPTSPRSYNPRCRPPWYIWKSRWQPLTIRCAISRWSHEKVGHCEQSIKPRPNVKLFRQQNKLSEKSAYLYSINLCCLSYIVCSTSYLWTNIMWISWDAWTP